MDHLSVALISAAPVDVRYASWSRYQSIAALLDDPGTQHVVVLNLPQAENDRALMLLRRDPRYRLGLVYTLQPHISSHPLTDGTLPESTADLQQASARLASRLAAFNRGRSPERLEEWVMAWLWTRPQADVVPRRDTASPQMYSYPLLEAFAADEPVNAAVWLRLLTEQGWLAEGELVDRVRQCRQCNSARLNYIDVCPACKALDIARQPAIHCFTCGHVAAQEQFLKQGLLLCPNCLTKLRHIGSDYDRPLENQSCRACRTSFMDADVEARCLDCDHSQVPEDLRVREVRHYRMTEKGRLRCRLGLTEELVGEYFERLQLISPDDFSMLLDWQIQQVRRYKQAPAISLLTIQFDGLENLLHNPEGQAAMDNLLERLEHSIRDTDRCTRTREDGLWLLLPHTDRQGSKVLWQRLDALVQLLEVSGSGLKAKMAAMTLPDDLLADEGAELLMARLAGEMG